MSGRYRPDLDPYTRARLAYGWQLHNIERAQRCEPPLTLGQYLTAVLGQVLPAPPQSAPGLASTHPPAGPSFAFGGEK
jgi:hypothetical protein